MDEKIRQIALEVYNQQNQTSQFSLVPIPFHIHNGIDSSAVPAQFLDFLNFAIWGQKTLSGGTITVTNTNIATTSVIIVTSKTTHVGGTSLAATCGTGVATITGQGTDVINYLIIF